MRNISVVGLFAGDEGKGKVVDAFAQDVDIVARVEGGANAGHTIKVGDFQMIGHLLPSGAMAGKICALCRGVRNDFPQLIREVFDFPKSGKTLPEIWVDAGALICFQWHKAIEFWAEHAKGSRKTYSTMRGMCGTAAALGLRVGPKVGMIFKPDELRAWLNDFYQVFAPIFQQPIFQEIATKEAVGGGIMEPDRAAEHLLGYADQIEALVRDVRWELVEALKQGRSILFEGAQGLMLDPYWGTYGFNTQGICTFAGIAVGSGLPVECLGRKIGVIKVVNTRVGNGPFVAELGDYIITQRESKIPADQKEAWLSEMRDKINAGWASPQEIGQYFRVIAHEYGATTGRPRRTGWMDLAWHAYACQVNNPDEIALTKLDCLSGLKKLRVVTGYRLSDETLQAGQVPALSSDLAQVEPIYQEVDGWLEDISGETDFSKLPKQAKAYVELVERFTRPVAIIGTGPDRSAVIIRQ